MPPQARPKRRLWPHSHCMLELNVHAMATLSLRSSIDTTGLSKQIITLSLLLLWTALLITARKYVLKHVLNYRAKIRLVG